MNMRRLLFAICFLSTFLFSYPTKGLQCSKIAPLKEKGVYECLEYGTSYKGKLAAIPKDARRLIYFNTIGPTSYYDEKKHQFFPDSTIMMTYKLYEITFTNGTKNGVVTMYESDMYKLKKGSEFNFNEPYIFYNSSVVTRLFFSNDIPTKELGYYDTGELLWESKCNSKGWQGKKRVYYQTGELKSEAPYVNDKVIGDVVYYRINGELWYKEKYHNGEFIEKECFDGRRGNYNLTCD